MSLGLQGPTYPGGSKSRVTRAGAAVRAGNLSYEDVAVIDTWRAAHRAVLNTFQAILRIRARGMKNVVVAQRHKRRITIFGKLERYPGMELARMDDIAGCRLIFPTINELTEFRAGLHKARFNHKRRNTVDKYDYIKDPKPTGYRGIHDVYEYDVNSVQGRPFKGLYVEIQYRTYVQHAWATAVEIIGFITESQPKFQAGDARYEEIMALASEILARHHENLTSCYPWMSGEELIQRFLELDGQLGLMRLMRSLNVADSEISSNRNVILMVDENEQLEMFTFRDATEALRALFELERANPKKDVVLVRADTTDEVRIAFRNYFADTGDFVRLVEEGCEALSGHEVIHGDPQDYGAPVGFG